MLAPLGVVGRGTHPAEAARSRRRGGRGRLPRVQRAL